MKIFQINTVYNSGSTGRIAAQIKNVVEKNGDECFVAFGRGESSDQNTECISSKQALYFHALMTRITDRTAFYSYHTTKKLIKRIKEFRPDVIHLHNIHGYYLNIKLLFGFLKKYDKPVVWTLHDCWPFTGHCVHFDLADCSRWQNGCYKCPQKKEYPASFFADCSARNYEDKRRLFTQISKMTIVCPSNWLAGLVKQSFLSKYDVKVINNGIDLNVFYPRKSDFKKKYNIEDKKMLLGVANGFVARKGYNDFIKLAETVDDNYIIVMVGLMPNEIKSLPKNIIGISKTESVDQLAEIYSTADFFLNLTYEDNFPTTNLESLACGTPIITYYTGGSPESISEGCGRYVKKGDIDAVCEIVANFRYDTNECINRSKFFNKDDKYKEYMRLYHELHNC